MNYLFRSSQVLFAAALIALAAPVALAQQKATPSLKSALTGTAWKVVSSKGTDEKGANRPIVMGKDVSGQLVLGANGRYNYMVVADMPKLAKDRFNTTAAEDKAVLQGVLAHYGTYTIDEKERTIALKIDRSSYPNQNGQVSKRVVTSLKGDELVLDNPARAMGGTTTVVLKKL